ncbi:hypothetical protein Rleg9DRAFT_5602 [Rhizobium leguminosarum bv. trifolii WSM597]|uniref:Transcriptional regulator n=3 Tax=Rhizobium leguminosarum TaxID=384 RepID=A0ABF7QUX2_RHILW|nr:hypothetical protein [Rhizobium leguminosarum]ACI57859.1 conserved hypothetical protein [Rhizobium leguminosarum bv. trifolii WSM2304]EJB06652.1 hypothetical protein Rleg9DRAFT_5602 [Rhizobium leguminosarum bv. trifolii WSM597]MBB6222682.1 hypothetical protein [Rhizobium leguminosarum]
MKTPWRFLVDLTSRRRPAKAQESAISHDTDAGALEREDDPTPARPSLSGKPSAKTDDDQGTPGGQVPVASSAVESDPDAARALESPVDIEEPRTAAPDEADHPRAEADVSAPKTKATGKLQNKRAVRRRARAKKAEAGVAAQSAVAAPEDPRSQPSPSRDPFFDDVASLDEDIKKLRSQLAQKLDLQNAQLRKMLERFGVS